MRHHDSPGERRALAEADAAAPGAQEPYPAAADAAEPAAADGADTAGEHADGRDADGRDADGADADGRGAERGDADGAGPDTAGRGRPGGLDGLLQRLERLPASHPSSPGYAGHGHGKHPAAWPPRAGEPYRPWFSAGEPGEPWFTEDPGDPAG